jgi:hypothetical protein
MQLYSLNGTFSEKKYFLNMDQVGMIDVNCELYIIWTTLAREKWVSHKIAVFICLFLWEVIHFIRNDKFNELIIIISIHYIF